MQPISCSISALLSLSLLAPLAAMALDGIPNSSLDRDLELSNLTEFDEAEFHGALLPLEPLEMTEAGAVGPGTTEVSTFGETLARDDLERYRGGTNISNETVSNGVVQDATAIQVVTGKNTIDDGAFAHASGLPIVIQNSGANSLIQNSVIINVQLK